MSETWIQIITILGANLALMLASIGTTVTLFLWSRSESRQDHAETKKLVEAIQTEMKDFHGRLCAIEERNRK